MKETAIITGGSRGIGRAIALKLAESGYHIALIYQGNTEKAEETVSLCKAYGVAAKAYRCDVSSNDEVKTTISEIRKDSDTVSVLVNNAGITRDSLIAMMSYENWESVINTNLRGTFLMIKHTVPLLLRNKGGRIVNISSVSGMMGNSGQANYSASKAGVIGLTKTVAKELCKKGITCNAIAPGFIKTEMTENLENSELLNSIPLGRMGSADDIADTALFLIKSSYITGEVIRVDGGLAM